MSVFTSISMASYESNDSVATLLKRIVDILDNQNVFETSTSTENSVVNFLHPIDLQVKLDLNISNHGITEKQLESLLENAIKYSIKTTHSHFHNQLYGGVDKYGLIGSWIADALNTNQYTYEVAPVFTLVEQSVLKHVLNKLSFQNGDGIFAPGGSISNMYAMVLARYKMFPDVKIKGIFNKPQLVAFTSQDSHYSIEKSVHWLGLGTDNLMKIKTDDHGRMIPEQLRSSIQLCLAEGRSPFFVNATAGTTVLGAFDPLNLIADICEEFQLWLHVDACWGGSLLFSDTHKDRLNGIHRVDSVSWNPHKMLGAPLQCSMLLLKQKDLLYDCNCVGAKYLFQQDKFYDISYDTGDKSIQCGRKVDAFKLWTMWKIRGDSGFEMLINNAMSCASYFKNAIAQRQGFKLVLSEFECTNICFWYIPPRLRNQAENEEWWNNVHKVAPKVKERMIMKGLLMIGYTPLNHKGLKNFFRFVTTCHPPPTLPDMDYVIHTIELEGDQC